MPGHDRETHQPVDPRNQPPTRPTRVIEDHPCPQAGPPPKAEDCGDLGQYRGSWWQSGLGWWSWSAAGIAIAIIVGVWLLRTVVGPMLSPATP